MPCSSTYELHFLDPSCDTETGILEFISVLNVFKKIVGYLNERNANFGMSFLTLLDFCAWVFS